MSPSLFLFAALLASGTTTPLKEQTPGLRAKASITLPAAEKSALARKPGAQVVEAELEVEQGRLVYSFDLRSAGKSGIDEVQIDAKNGEVVSVEHEDAAAEAAEKDADAKAQKNK